MEPIALTPVQIQRYGKAIQQAASIIAAAFKAARLLEQGPTIGRKRRRRRARGRLSRNPW